MSVDEARAGWTLLVVGVGLFFVVLVMFLSVDFIALREKRRAKKRPPPTPPTEARWRVRIETTALGLKELLVVLETPDGRPLKAFAHGKYEFDQEFTYRQTALWAEAQAIADGFNEALDNPSTA